MPSIDEKGGVSRGRTSFHLEIEVAENWIACREGTPGAPDEAGVWWVNDIVADGGHPEGKGTTQPPPEEVDEGGKGGEGVEGGESESKSRMESKPQALGKYEWKWKVRNPGSLPLAPY